MRGRPRAWPTRSSAFRRAESIPFPEKKSAVFLMTSSTVSMGNRPPRRDGHSGHLGQFLLEVRLLQRRNQRVDRSFHHLREIVQGKADAVVGDPILGKVIGADPLAAIAGSDLAAALGRVAGVFLVNLELEQARSEDRERPGLVL